MVQHKVAPKINLYCKSQYSQLRPHVTQIQLPNLRTIHWKNINIFVKPSSRLGREGPLALELMSREGMLETWWM
jgi:hypothetical protein